MATFHVRLLGGMRVERGGDVVPIGPPRVRELLAYLLLERHGALSRAHLAFQLWPDSSEGQARTNLRQTLHQLRRLLPEAERWLVMEGQDLRWRPEAAIDSDVGRFERQLAVATVAREADDVELERRALASATLAYRGELLPESYAAWVEPHRSRLHQACAHALERLAGLLARQRDDLGAIDAVQRLIRHEPLAEAPYRLLMQLHERCGERAKALHAYHTCATLFRRELGVDPTPETRALHERLLRLEASLPGREGAAGAAARTAAPPPLVGREGELDLLRAAWRRAIGGRPQLVLLAGDAGIGKTRLVEEFAHGLRRGEGSVVGARCYAVEAGLAYAPVATLLRADVMRPAVAELADVWRSELAILLPELHGERAPPVVETWRRARLFEAVARACASVQPLLVVLDDLHACDPDTLAWLHFLLRFDAHARLLVVATARGHEVDGHAALSAWLAALRDEGSLLEAELPPLSLEETAALAHGLGCHGLAPAEIAALYADSEGNPLFVIELLRAGLVAGTSTPVVPVSAGAPALPPRLRTVIRARLARLSATSAELVGVAAVIGRAFDLDLLVRVSGRAEDAVVRALDELWARRVVREQGAGQYDFTHDKLREVAYEDLSLTRRRLLHRYAAEALEGQRVDGPDEACGRVALHYDRAGLPERAVAQYLRAGEVARRRFADEEAAARYRRGLELVTGLPAAAALADWRARMTADLLEGLGEVDARRAKHDLACDAFTRALAARPARDAVGRARLFRRIGDTWVLRYAYGEAEAAYARAEDALGALPTVETTDDARRERIDIGLARADAHYWQHRWDEIERDLLAVRDLAIAHASPRQLSRFYSGLALMHFSRERQTVSSACLELMRSGHAAAERTGDADAIAGSGFLLGFLNLWHGALEEAEAHMRAALADAERVHKATLRVRCLTYLAVVHRRLGDLDAVRSLSADGLRAAVELGMPEYVGAAHGQRAWLAWRSGDLEACERAGHAAIEAWRVGPPYPLQWIARLPLLGVESRRARWREAVAHAAVLVDPDQQRLPYDLDAALAGAVAADADGEAAAVVRERLELVLDAAACSGLI
ncbi:MAG: ATP-binding protein [Trueperaceae bacterium]